MDSEWIALPRPPFPANDEMFAFRSRLELHGLCASLAHDRPAAARDSRRQNILTRRNDGEAQITSREDESAIKGSKHAEMLDRGSEFRLEENDISTGNAHACDRKQSNWKWNTL